MAKISARGEHEIARWTKAGGDTLVLTVRKDGKPGRLLRKWTQGAGYTLVHAPDGKPTLPTRTSQSGGGTQRRRPTFEQAEAFALANGYERVR